MSEEAASILVVEDEMFVSEYICQSLTKLGYRVCGVADCYEEALQLVAEESPDLILLDIELSGDKSGVDVASEVLEKWAIPVVFLTAYSDDQTLVKVKQTKPMGYITKPFTENDIKIAVMMALQRTGSGGKVIQIKEGYSYDTGQQQLFHDDEPVWLTKKELKLIHILASKYNQVVSYQAIEDCLWEGVIVSESSLRALVLRLRKKLPDIPIQNVSGIGYLLKDD